MYGSEVIGLSFFHLFFFFDEEFCLGWMDLR